MTPYRERREAGAYEPTDQPTDPIEVRAEQVEAEEGTRQEQTDEQADEEGEAEQPIDIEEAVAYGRSGPPPAPAEAAPVRRPRGRPRKNPLPSQ